MGFVTNEQIYEEQQVIKKMLTELLQDKSESNIDEISLTKASKRLKRSTTFLKREVEKGRLKAITYRDKNKVKHYRFRIKDIEDYQDNKSTVLITEIPVVETAEEIADKIFPGRRSA